MIKLSNLKTSIANGLWQNTIDDLIEEHFVLPYVATPFLIGEQYPNSKIHVGFSKWSYEEWKGNFFPLKIKKQETLLNYGCKFNCVELNATHYSFFPDTQFQKWLNKVEGLDFTFCLNSPSPFLIEVK